MKRAAQIVIFQIATVLSVAVWGNGNSVWANSEWRAVPPAKVARVLHEIARRQGRNLSRFGTWQSVAKLRDRSAMNIGVARDRYGVVAENSSSRFTTEYTATVQATVDLSRQRVISRLSIDGEIRFGDPRTQVISTESGDEWTRWTLFDGQDVWTYRPLRKSGPYHYGPSRLEFDRPTAGDVGAIDQHWFARGFACHDGVFDPRQCFGGPELAIGYLKRTAAAIDGLIASNAFEAGLFRLNRRERNGTEYQWIVSDPSWSVPAYLRRRSEWIVAERVGFHFTHCRTIRQVDGNVLFESHIDFTDRDGTALPTTFTMKMYDPENGQYRYSRSVRFIEQELGGAVDARTFSLGDFDLPRSTIATDRDASVATDTVVQGRRLDPSPESARSAEPDLVRVWRSLLVLAGSAGFLLVGFALAR